MEVYEAGGDEGVYPGTGVSIAVGDQVSGGEEGWKRVCSRREDLQVNDKVVGWPRRWCKENDHCYDPVEE